MFKIANLKIICTDSTEMLFSKLRSAGLNYHLPKLSFFTDPYCAGVSNMHIDVFHFQQKFLESEGGHAAIATRLKRKKLHESFPTIDTTLLDQIFQVNW